MRLKTNSIVPKTMGVETHQLDLKTMGAET
jgi:hypothetical protein